MLPTPGPPVHMEMCGEPFLVAILPGGCYRHTVDKASQAKHSVINKMEEKNLPYPNSNSKIDEPRNGHLE